MGTFGRTDTGNQNCETSNSYKDTSRFQFTGLTGSTLTTISVYVASGACSVKAALYSNKAGPAPDALLASGGPTAKDAAATWVDVPVNYVGLTNNAYYWLCSKESTDPTTLRASNTISNYQYLDEDYAVAFSNPFGAGNSDAFEMCIHADYTEPSGVTVKKGSNLASTMMQMLNSKMFYSLCNPHALRV